MAAARCGLCIVGENSDAKPYMHAKMHTGAHARTVRTCMPVCVFVGALACMMLLWEMAFMA